MNQFDPRFSVAEKEAMAVVDYDDLIVTHDQAVIDGLIHSDETPLSLEDDHLAYLGKPLIGW